MCFFLGFFSFVRRCSRVVFLFFEVLVMARNFLVRIFSWIFNVMGLVAVCRVLCSEV